MMVSFGYMLASMAAGVFIGFGFYNEIFASGPPVQSWEEDFLALVSLGVGFASIALIGIYTFGIGAIFITMAEFMRWKGLIANLVMGGAIGGILALTGFAAGEGNSISDGALLVALSAGFIGGIVYWIIAGRRAGDWWQPTGAKACLSSEFSKQRH